jgi:regulator of sigma D
MKRGDQMEIEGPLSIAVQEDESSLKRELHISFKPAFIQEKLFERTEAFQNYIDHLKHQSQKMDHADPDRLGIETILQICENLVEYIAKDDIDLEQTIVIEVNPNINITRFITGTGTIN